MLYTKGSETRKRGGSDGQPSSKPLGGLIWKPLRGGLRICLESAPAPSLPPFGGGSTLFAPVPALPPSPTTNPLICSPAHRLSTLGKLSKVVCWAAQSGKSPYQGPVCFPTPQCSCSLQWEENHLAIFGSLDCPHQSSSRQHHTCCLLTPKMTCQSFKSMPFLW